MTRSADEERQAVLDALEPYPRGCRGPLAREVAVQVGCTTAWTRWLLEDLERKGLVRRTSQRGCWRWELAR